MQTDIEKALRERFTKGARAAAASSSAATASDVENQAEAPVSAMASGFNRFGDTAPIALEPEPEAVDEP